MIMPREILFVWVAAGTALYGYLMVRIMRSRKQKEEKPKPEPADAPPLYKMEEYPHA